MTKSKNSKKFQKRKKVLNSRKVRQVLNSRKNYKMYQKSEKVPKVKK